MTGAELVTRIKQHLGNRDAPTGESTWYVDRMNDGYRWLHAFKNEGRRLKFPEFYDIKSRTIGASPSDNFEPLQSGVFAVLGLFNVTDGVNVQIEPFRSFIKRKKTNTGRINKWTPFGQGNVRGYLVNNLVTVSTSLNEYVYNQPETLANDAVAPIIDPAWHRVIHLIGGAIGAEMFSIDAKSAQLFQLATAEIKLHATPDEEDNIGGLRHFIVGERVVPVRGRT